VFFIFGWLRRFTVLGIKIDECQTCGRVCEHVVARKTRWGHLFWIPVLFLGFEHGMACTACASWTPIPWQSVRAAMKSGLLPLDRRRPNASAALAAEGVHDDSSVIPSLAMFDRLLVNPKRGPWDIYLKACPVLVALILVIGAVSPRTSASGTGVPSNGANTTLYAPAEGPAHTCWQAPDGTVTGCRLANGSLMGYTTAAPITCYFFEPLPASATSVSCNSN
jgi:hypothetical protein